MSQKEPEGHGGAGTEVGREGGLCPETPTFDLRNDMQTLSRGRGQTTHLAGRMDAGRCGVQWIPYSEAPEGPQGSCQMEPGLPCAETEVPTL